MIKVKNSLQFIGIVILGMVGVIICSLIITNVMNVFGIAASSMGMILLTWSAMLIGFGIIPTFLLRRKYSITKLEVGFGPISVLEIIICLFIIGITFLYIVIGRNITNVILFTIAIFQNIGVAIFEEYFSKGILFFIAKKITSNKVIIVLICSCVFAFVLHSSDSFMTNLEYRLPMSVILGVCYLKTNNLYLPITLHLVNNLLATSLLK
ncbi:CPBP family intramembrane metalloprotease [Lachnospiraceae bacterium MD1]|jgi:membrane protease YdiL (CAAX protease family)|uniref:CPBP family intramembrane metalloprotease n=1 Tax=Variimorphobacter saccharofermentans TaxID=2755051 RepID=A0A839JX85_9FIRM|nr:CPBP family intramembrane glutamic endopeptidase [Variimorphobacter saccharofermentans]MBB2181884.1 CPBP family intramembrane metalloprotease [Variimorphobacter saccharofermentans]